MYQPRTPHLQPVPDDYTMPKDPIGPHIIDLAANRLAPPRIVPVESIRKKKGGGGTASARDRSGAVTAWETPFNRPDHEPDRELTSSQLASRYMQQGRLEEAETLYKRSLRTARNSNDTEAIVRAIEDLGWFYYSVEKYDRAEPYVSRLLQMRSNRLPAADQVLVGTVDRLASIYEKTSRSQDAVALYKFLLARQEDVYGTGNLHLPQTLKRLADCYKRQGHYAAAETALSRSLRIQEPVYGRSSLEITPTLEDLSEVYQKMESFDRAAELLERLLHILEHIHGPDGIAVASCLLKLADLLTKLDMVHEAEPLYRRVVAIYRRLYGSKTAEVSVTRNKMRSLYPEVRKQSRFKPEEQEICGPWPAITPEILSRRQLVSMPGGDMPEESRSTGGMDEDKLELLRQTARHVACVDAENQ